MVSIKGVKGFVPLLQNIGTTPQQRYLQTENGRLKSREATKRYLQTQNGRGKLREAQKRYNSTDKGKERTFRYQNKPFHCDICNKDMKLKNKYDHCQTKKHFKNNINLV